MKKVETSSIECFVIMPISDQSGYDDGHFQLVYEDIIKPAIVNAGMVPVRADDTKGANLIQLDILKKVVKLPIAVCDISSKNPNVFYELGMRQAFDMPTVILKDTKTNAPFDISGLRYCVYNANMKYREVGNAVKELSNVLSETYANRGDLSEVNSLIRLLELSNAAELPSTNLSSEQKELKFLALRMEDMAGSFENLTKQLTIHRLRDDLQPFFNDGNVIKHSSLDVDG